MKATTRVLTLSVLGAVLIAGVAVLALWLTADSGRPAQAGTVTPITVGFDMEPFDGGTPPTPNSCPGDGTTDCTLGNIDPCVSVPSVGGSDGAFNDGCAKVGTYSEGDDWCGGGAGDTFDQDGDTTADDGCPGGPAQVGAISEAGDHCSETACADADSAAPWDNCDDDGDTKINDGCPQVACPADCDANEDGDCADTGEAALCDNNTDDDPVNCVDFDVFLKDLPPKSGAGAAGFAGFAYAISEKNGATAVGDVTTFTHGDTAVNLLVQADTAMLQDFSAPTGTEVTSWYATAADVGIGPTPEYNPPFTQGVVSRVRVDLAGGPTPAGVYYLTIDPLGTDIPVSVLDVNANDYCDPASPVYVGCTIQDGESAPQPYGIIAVGQACPEFADLEKVDFQVRPFYGVKPAFTKFPDMADDDGDTDVDEDPINLVDDDYDLLTDEDPFGFLGIDNDGDTRVDEDGAGRIDFNGDTWITPYPDCVMVAYHGGLDLCMYEDQQQGRDDDGDTLVDEDPLDAEVSVQTPYFLKEMFRNNGPTDWVGPRVSVSCEPPESIIELLTPGGECSYWVKYGYPSSERVTLDGNLLECNQANLPDGVIKCEKEGGGGGCGLYLGYPPGSCLTGTEIKVVWDHTLDKHIEYGPILEGGVYYDYELWDIHCYEPSLHKWHFTNDIEPWDPDIIDSNDANNHLELELAVACIAQADVGFEDWDYAPLTAYACYDTDVTVTKSLDNDGPWDPVDVDLEDSLAPPAECESTFVGQDPDNPVPLPAPGGGTADVDEVWTINCHKVGSMGFFLDNGVFPHDPHILDDFLWDNFVDAPVDLNVVARMGDVNTDGFVDIDDVVLILQYILERVDLTDTCPPGEGYLFEPAADAAGDGVDIIDAVLILQCILDRHNIMCPI